MSRIARLSILFGVIFAISAGFMYYYYTTTRTHQAESGLLVLGEQGHKVRPFAFANQKGDTITQKDVAGKIYVVSYFFATCEGICPRMNENLAKVYNAFRGDTSVLILSHTVNPDVDTPAALAAYGNRLGANPDQWWFLTGDKKKLYDQARYSYLISADEDTTGVSIQDDFIHDQHFVLIDRFGNIRGKFYDGLNNADIKQLIADIRKLEQEKI